MESAIDKSIFNFNRAQNIINSPYYYVLGYK